MFIFVEYTCPETGYMMLIENINADADYVTKGEDIDKKVDIETCRKECENEEKCDFFMYLHENQQCDMWEFKRRSKLLQIGLTNDAIFCIKIGMLSVYILYSYNYVFHNNANYNKY